MKCDAVQNTHLNTGFDVFKSRLLASGVKQQAGLLVSGGRANDCAGP